MERREFLKSVVVGLCGVSVAGSVSGCDCSTTLHGVPIQWKTFRFYEMTEALMWDDFPCQSECYRLHGSLHKNKIAVSTKLDVEPCGIKYWLGRD